MASNPYDQFTSSEQNPYDKFVPTKQESLGTNNVGGLKEAIMEPLSSMASGTAASALGGVAGGVASMIPGLPQGTGRDVSSYIQDLLTYKPRTEAGQWTLGKVSAPFEWLANKADQAGQYVTDKTGSPLAGTAVNTALQAAPMAVGKAASKFTAGGESPASIASRNALKTANASQDATLNLARESNIGVPPSQANPSLLNKILEGFGGKVKTAQGLSTSNAPKFNAMVKAELGIDENTRLSVNELERIRSNAGQKYESVRNSGAIVTDEAYTKALDNIIKPFETSAKDFPNRKVNDVAKEIKGLRFETVDSSSAVDQLKLLRDDADKAFRTGDKAAGKAYREAMSALEGVIERNLEKNGGNPSLVSDYRKAKQLIAQTYTIQKHLNDATGNVNALGLANDLKKQNPLSGEIKKVAEIASQFPKAAQSPEKIGGNPFSLVDMGLGALGYFHNPGMAALAVSRPLTRGLISSEGYQRIMTKPQTYGRPLLDVLREDASKNGVTLGSLLANKDNQ